MFYYQTLLMIADLWLGWLFSLYFSPLLFLPKLPRLFLNIFSCRWSEEWFCELKHETNSLMLSINFVSNRFISKKMPLVILNNLIQKHAAFLHFLKSFFIHSLVNLAFFFINNSFLFKEQWRTETFITSVSSWTTVHTWSCLDGKEVGVWFKLTVAGCL